MTSEAATIPRRTRAELANMGIPDRIMDAMAQDHEIVIVENKDGVSNNGSNSNKN